MLSILLFPTGEGEEATHLDKRVDDANVGTGIEDLVEARLSVHQLQLVKLLVILEQQVKVTMHPNDYNH